MSGMLAAIVTSLGWALIDFVWQGTLVACATAMLLAPLRKAGPQLRYALACAALLLCAALPVAGTVERVLAMQAAPGTNATLSTAPAGRAGRLSQSLLTADKSSVATHALTFANESLASLQTTLSRRMPLVILIWAGGAAALALRMLLGLLWVSRLRRQGHARTNAHWQARLDRMAASMGLARRVTLGLVDGMASPVTAGWWRPVVLVPAALVSGMPPDLLEALLAHELAHVRRHDYLVNLIQGAIEILLFYHPGVWWLSRRIRDEREQIADDIAASTLGEPRRLALALSELDLFQLSTPQLALAAQGGNLMSRIKRLVRPESEPLNWKLALPILGLALCAALSTHAGTALAAAADEAVVRKIHNNNGHSRDDAYAIVRETDHGTNLSGDSADWKDIEASKRALTGEFIWFRDGGKTWVVQDPDILARANTAWAPVDKLGEQMDVYGRQMDAHGKTMEAMGKDMEQAGMKMGPDRKTVREFERRMDAMGHEMEALGEQIADANSKDRERLQRKMNELGAKMSAEGERFRKEQESSGRRQAQASMEEIGKRMHEAGKPMDELGKQMGALGKQMEQESKIADKTVRALLREAQQKGLARPAPGSANS
jgi:beta-lactamase regulating signal transducer with metallopeptidase domain